MSNNIPISLQASGLIKREPYSYEIVGLGGNWPAVATPATGLFIASAKTQMIDTIISFCANTGLCLSSNDNVLNYELINDYNTNSFFSVVRAEVTPVNGGDTIYSSYAKAECSGCLPDVSILIEDTDVKLTESNSHMVKAHISGLVYNTQYSYQFICEDSNWPTVLSISSGTFVAESSSADIFTRATFCATTGVCQGLGYNVLNHTLSNAVAYGNLNPVTRLKLAITTDGNFANVIDSDSINIECINCLPKLVIDIPSEPVSLIGTNNYCYDIVANLSGLIPYKDYNYEFRSTVANWPSVITPISGVFKSSKTTGNIRSRLAFCPATSVCGSGTMGLLDYDINKYKYLFDSTCGNFVALELAMTPSDNSMLESISDSVTVYCLDCLGPIVQPSLKINVSPST
jgi:hypothetical protein